MPPLNLNPFNIPDKTPIAARVTFGRQPPERLGQGFPIAKDRLWICSPVADGQKVKGRNGDYTQRFLPLHPDFARFNDDPFLAVEQWDDNNYGALLRQIIDGKDPEGDEYVIAQIKRAVAGLAPGTAARWRPAMERFRKTRRTLRAVIVHPSFLSAPASDNDAGWLRFAAQAAKTTRGESLIPHPQKRPACISSDGVTAKRHTGNGVYANRECLAEKCPFREAKSAVMGDGQACQKTISLVFQLRWPSLCWRCGGLAPTCPECKGSGVAVAMPSALAELECSGSFNFAAQSIVGFFEETDRQWRSLGLPGEPDYIGLPFAIHLAHKTGEGKAFWTLIMTHDFEPGMDFQRWAFTRAQMRVQGKALMVGDAPLMIEAETPQIAYQRTRVAPITVPAQDVIDG